MRIHTDVLYSGQVRRAVSDPDISPDVHLVVGPCPFGSRKRDHAFEVQLGTYDSSTGPTRSRHFKNTGTHGADRVWAATYDEWGWFLANLFALDPFAIAGPYDGVEDFNRQTSNKYVRATVS